MSLMSVHYRVACPMYGYNFDHILWFQGRNRRCITVDMRQEEGRDIIRQLANNVDVLVENFRPGVMEKWKLGPQVSVFPCPVTCNHHSMPALCIMLCAL